ncbi:MAG: 4'-phosphopantetheinyl transferase superfamily protein [Magnetococcus sp. DMHC-6]
MPDGLTAGGYRLQVDPSVDLWLENCQSLLASQSQTDLWHLLDEDECTRWRRFRSPFLRNFFLASHATLRLILSRYLPNSPAGSLRFSYTDKGRPFLSAEQNPQHVDFNLSHSGEWIAVVVGRGCRVGIDLEFMDDKEEEIQSIAERFFHSEEIHHLSSLTNKQAVLRDFYRLWTAREALYKAYGSGLHELNATQSFLPILASGRMDCFKNDVCYRLVELNVLPGYAGWVAFGPGERHKKSRPWGIASPNPPAI